MGGALAVRTIDALVNGVDWWLRDPVDVVDRAPYDVVHEHAKLRVRRYHAPDWEEYAGLGASADHLPGAGRHPVLLIPPLMVKPFIFDLSESRSYVRTLLAAGFDVYLVDFGEPDSADTRVTLDDYVLDWLPQAVDATLRHSGRSRISLCGYCQGGMFALMHTSANDDSRVSGIVTIGSPVDSDEMGLLIWLMRVAHVQLDAGALLMGNVPGALSSVFFKLLSPLKHLTRYSGLLRNLGNDEYVQGFDALSAWTQNFIDWPRDAFRQLLSDFFVENKLAGGQMAFGDKVADLRRIHCPVLAFAGASDRIVPESAVRAVVSLVSSTDTEVRVVPGGHMGVFAGRHAPREVWEYSARWLAARSPGEPPTN